MPGWKRSEQIRPIANTEGCRVQHFPFVSSGRLRIVQDDGPQWDMGPGDFATLPLGSDGTYRQA
jgi:hypothetical protein